MTGWTYRIVTGGLLALMALSTYASFLFGQRLAELAGMPLYLTGLWPIVVALTLSQAVLFYVLLAGPKSVRWYFGGQVLLAALVSFVGNAITHTRDLQELPGIVSVVVTSVPMLCLLVCVYNTVIFLRYRRGGDAGTAPAA